MAAALARSRRGFGDEAERRYAALIARALAAIGADARLAGSRPIAAGSATRLYHLRHARDEGVGVGRPRHFVVFRAEPEIIVVLRLLHDAMNLPSHLAD